MSRFLFLLLVFSISLASVKAQSQHDTTVTEIWKFSTGGKIYGAAAADKNVVYFGSEDSTIYAVEAVSGKKLWSLKTNGSIYSAPLIQNGNLYVLSMDGTLYALDTGDGKPIWKFRTGGEKKFDTWDYYLSDAVISGDKLVFGSTDQNVYAVNCNTGKLIWKYKTEGIVHASPQIIRDTVYIGSFDGSLYALNLSNGRLIWKFRSIGDAYFPNGEFQKAALVTNQTVFAGSRDFNIYALNAATGRGKWNMKEVGSWVIATPLWYNDKIYFGTSDSHSFVCMDANAGTVDWRLKLDMRVYGSAVEANGLIWFGCFNGRFYGVNPSNGVIVTQFQTEKSKKNYSTVYDANGNFRSDFEHYGDDYLKGEKKILNLGSFVATPVVHDGILYVGSADGNMYALKLTVK